MKAIILSIGDELVLGQTVDTNSAWLSQQLATVGCGVAAHLTVSDDQRAIEQAILESVGRCDVLLITGGIGPTDDDLTRQALAAVMGVELEMNGAWLGRLEAFFRKVGRPMSPLNRIQAMIPRGATMIENTNGTAAGIDATYQSPDHKTVCRVFVTPGVPKEMKAMFERDILPHVRARGGGAVILSRTLHTFGSGESLIAQQLGDLMRRDRNPSVGTTVTGGVVSLRINARFANIDEARRQLEETAQACRAALGDLVYGQDNESLPDVVGRLLCDRGVTVTTAESCTGGLLAKYLTDVAGSSAYFNQAWVTYSNDAKTRLLGVPEPVLIEHGAVSEPVVRILAANARDRAAAGYALAISGMAGPDGGTPAKPVGTVWIALAAPPAGAATGPSVEARRFVFPGERTGVRDRAAKTALALLRLRLLGRPVPF